MQDAFDVHGLFDLIDLLVDVAIEKQPSETGLATP